MLRFWREYARRYRGWYFIGLLCLIATNVLTVAIPDFIRFAVDALDEGRGPTGAVPWAIAILATGVGIMVVRTLSRTLFFNPGRTVEFRIKNKLFSHLLELPNAFFQRMRAGEIISRGTNDTNGVRALIGFASLQLFNVGLTLTLTLSRMLFDSVFLTAVCVIPLIFAALILRYAVGEMFRLVRAQQVQLAVLSDRILENYSGVGVIQAYGAEQGALDRFDVANDEMLRLSLGMARIQSWLLPVVSVTGHICIVIVLFVGGGMVAKGEMTVGGIAAFVGYLNILVVGLTSMGWFLNALQRGYVSLGRVYDVLDAPLERQAVAAEVPEAGDHGYGLRVTGLDFTFPQAGPMEDGGAVPADRPEVLHGLDFEVAPGEVVGIFGRTGCGKSTLMDLVARVYDPPEGTIFLDGVDVSQLSSREYWKRVAYVPQSAFLFSRRIQDNIALGTPRDARDESRVLSAAHDAALAADLDVLVDGLDTEVGERGVTLSGGQRQRIALARAFYRDFELLLLDDVLSAVDHATETKVIDAIYRRCRHATALIVSHRVSVLARANRVLVLEAGRIVDVGTHDELVARGQGPYYSAWRLQTEEAAERGVEVAGG